MHFVIRRNVWLAGLLALPLLAHATPLEDQWFTVLLDGRKIGAFESKREVKGSQVVTTQALELVLDRAGSHVALGSTETSTETADGQPLAFRSLSRLSGNETIVDGRLRNGAADITTRSSGETRQRRLPWPNGALLPEGQRLAGLRAGLAPGTKYRALSFQPSSLDAAEVVSVVAAPEEVDLPGGRMRLYPVEQTIAFPGAPMKTRAWVDADQTIHKLTMPIMGVELTLLACDHACATAPNQGTDVFERTLMPSPRPLRIEELAGAMRYTLAARDRDAKLALPETDEQRVERRDGAVVVTIRRTAAAHAEAKPDANDYAPNDWLQSKAPEIVRLAQRAVGDARAPRERMQRIEAFVRGFIRTKSLDVGYASALEVARKPEGDCTEHAVLVAALGRALGIATRVVDGLAYAPGFAGKDQVFVPHAWAQAFVDGRWQSFDAALHGFDAGHIALSVGDGDPWRFYSGLDLLGRIELRKAESIAEPIQ
ncbi:transglutaminase-like domain-containing protein [Dokdonella soli]|uniref:Transglutaminase-like domain-containing protein n=1 Tax=Dokdonella soli TaxID=529810 RepID=A0ABN1IBA2_9GAMM